MNMRFSDRVAIITGGSRGLGFSIAEKLASEGAKIVLFDIDEEALQTAKEQLKTKDIDVFTKVVDIVNSEEVDSAVEEVSHAFETIDILVNNAGIIRDNLVFRMSNEDWQQVLNVHLNGAFNMTRAVQTHMVKQQYGRIINVSSTSALGNRGQLNYATSKAGIQGFTKTLAIELGQFGITSNAVAPGFIKTEMTKRVAERLNVPFEAFLDDIAKTVPAGRVGKPEDIANVVAFFADECSSYVNGQVIYVAGGPKD